MIKLANEYMTSERCTADMILEGKCSVEVTLHVDSIGTHKALSFVGLHDKATGSYNVYPELSDVLELFEQHTDDTGSFLEQVYQDFSSFMWPE